MMSTVGVRVELGARDQRGACLGRRSGSDRRRDVVLAEVLKMAANARRTGPAVEAHFQRQSVGSRYA